MHKTASIYKFFCVLFMFCMFSMASATEEAGQAFGKAWQNFKNGEFSKSREIVDYYLSADITDDHRANFTYLLGNLQSKRNEHQEESLISFQTAYQLYTETDSDYGRYVAGLGVAQASMALDRTAEAEVALYDSIEIGKEAGYPVSYPFHLLARLSFDRGDYHDAMGLSYWEHHYTDKEDPGAVAEATLSMAFYRMINGYFENGYELSLKAQADLAVAGDGNKYFYSLLVTALYQKCQGGNYQSHLNIVQQRMRRNDDDGLAKLFHFVNKFECNNMRLMDGEPPPPPPAPWIPVPGE